MKPVSFPTYFSYIWCASHACAKFEFGVG